MMRLPRKLAWNTSRYQSNLEYAPSLIFGFLLTLIREQPSGAEKATNVLPDISSEEKKLLEACKADLKGNIEKGINFVHNPPPK